ncbi:hypothetical protein D7Y22_04990 [Stenotrophomonas maltophilia]|uniref:hypothetical protein n=1 Tax=Stenotrophomonas maltophilia TaxID=40324 RepID=UPI0015DDA39F|nr:hypothetical protein [Stenotrophomonas maltophilia]MBA0420321.1 hypothetical protein [Stenotrophomonas maltophilia]
MSYVKKDGVPVDGGQTVLELDTGDLVAVVCTRTLQGGQILFRGRARAITEAGLPLVGPDGVPIEREFQHSDPRPAKADEVARDVLLALLGEPPQLVVWSDQVLLDVSIRQALALATINTGAVDASSVL